MASNWRPWQPLARQVSISRSSGGSETTGLDQFIGEFLVASFAHCKEARSLLSQPGPVP